RRWKIASAQLRIAGLLPTVDQEIEFQVEAQRPMRGNVAACRNAERQVKIIVRSVPGVTGRAIRQMTKTPAGIGRPRPSLTDHVLTGEGAGFQIRVVVASLAAR